MNFCLHHPTTRSGVGEANRVRFRGKCLQRVGANRIQLKQLADHCLKLDLPD
jgi:hypothetical protein